MADLSARDELIGALCEEGAYSGHAAAYMADAYRAEVREAAIREGAAAIKAFVDQAKARHPGRSDGCTGAMGARELLLGLLTTPPAEVAPVCGYCGHTIPNADCAACNEEPEATHA